MLLNFLNTVANLKEVPRQGWIDNLGLMMPESVSDHTYSLTILALIFSEIQKLDTLKILKMSLIHDLAESKTGDFTPGRLPKIKKNKIEDKVMRHILNDLPSNVKDDLFSVWTEFLEQKTPESILIHELDKLEMVLQAKIYEKNLGCNVQPFLDSAENEIKTPELKELFMNIVKQ